MFIDAYLANITVFAGSFAPSGWMFCQGQLLSISEYTPLYSLIGTTYGGDGQVTFALPDLRSRVANHMGQGNGLSNYNLGQMAGNETVSLTSAQLPGHSHAMSTFAVNIPVSTSAGTTNSPAGAVPAAATIYTAGPDGNTMGSVAMSSATPIAGSGQPVSIVQPVLAMNYIIAVEGIFPSRN